MRPLPLLAALALAACSGPVDTGFGGFSGFGGFGGVSPAPVAPRGERDSRAETCQAEATRVVQWRDRGQLMRNDEIENRGDGNITVAPPSRAESDRLGAALERDRIAAECYRAARDAQPAVPGGGAARRQ